MLKKSGRQVIWKRPSASDGPLEETPAVFGRGPATGPTPIALVGPFPSTEDGLQDELFTNGVGRFLAWGLTNADIYRPRLWLTNVCSHVGRPRSVDPNMSVQTSRESADFHSEVQYLLKDRQLKVLLLLGEDVIGYFGLTSALSSVRGSVYVFDVKTWELASQQSSDTVLLIPTHHPGHLLRNRWTKSGKGKADISAVWVDDLSKAQRLSVEGWNPPAERFNLDPSTADIQNYVDSRLEDKSLIAVDIETTGFSPAGSRIVCVGLAHTSEDAIVVPFVDAGGIDRWTPREEREVVSHLNRLFVNGGGLMFQNALFDIPFLRAKGFNIPAEALKHDTLLLHHAVTPELPHNLGFIVSQYGDTPYWKDEFQNRDTTIVRMDQEVLRRYNARDCVVLHQVLTPLLEDLNEVEALDVYTEESIALVDPILEMMSTGVKFDPKRRNVVRRRLEEEIAEKELGLRTLGHLPPAFNLSSDDDLRLFLFGIASAKYDKADELESKKPGTKVHAALTALADIRQNTTPLYEVGGFKPRRTDNGKITVNKQGRLSLQRHLQNRMAELNRFKRPSPKHATEQTEIDNLLLWLEMFNDYTELQKIHSTYMDFPVEEDGRIHTKFKIHGTATGRLSSNSPNLQNIPKRKGSDIRSFFVAEDGFVILSADYSNLEVKVLAYETGDPPLIDIVDGGLNMHDVNTQVLFGLTPEDEMWKPGRAAAKIFMFGSLAYGGGDREIYEKVILDVPQLRLTFSEFVAAKERYMEAHPVYVEWREAITKEVTASRQVRNAFGRVRTFYGNARDIVKEALNFPIQSAAASIINRATVRIWRRLRAGNFRSRLQAQIHDELRFEVANDELADVAKLVKEEMERPLNFRGRTRSFQTSMEVGPNWADLTAYSEGAT